jgi:hypothetical protein
MTNIAAIVCVIGLLSSTVQSFVVLLQPVQQQRQISRQVVGVVSRTTIQNSKNNPYLNTNTVINVLILYNTGGWGIGPQRELTPEEFATGGVQNKKYFEGYQIRNRGEFMRQVALDKDDMKRSELDELLGVAAAAGLKVKDPKERLNKFDSSILVEEEDLDVSVQWDTDDSERMMTNAETITSDSAPTDSITRLDEDTGALGVW